MALVPLFSKRFTQGTLVRSLGKSLPGRRLRITNRCAPWYALRALLFNVVCRQGEPFKLFVPRQFKRFA